MVASWRIAAQCSSDNLGGRSMDMSLRRMVVLMGHARLGAGSVGEKARRRLLMETCLSPPARHSPELDLVESTMTAFTLIMAERCLEMVLARMGALPPLS